MEATCPECRHVVVVESDRPVKCGNCGAKVPPPPPKTSPASTPDQLVTAPPPTIPVATPIVTDSGTKALNASEPAKRAAAVVAFVFSLLVFIPFVTQAIAVAVGLFAVLRKRRPNERVVLAWLALGISLVGLLGWLRVLNSVTFWKTPAAIFNTVATPNDSGEWAAVEDLEEQVQRIHTAASAHLRDFRRWPDTVDVMLGRSLPPGFAMPPDLHYRPVPPSAASRLDWVLIVSSEVRWDLAGNELNRPHRLVLRLSGKVEVLPSDQVAVLLEEQSAEPSTPDNPPDGP